MSQLTPLLTKEELERRSAQLVREAQSGKDTAFTQLYRLHAETLNNYIARKFFGADPDKARDTTQRAFIKAFRALPTFRGDSTFSTWLTAIARNEAISSHNRSKGDALRHSFSSGEADLNEEYSLNNHTSEESGDPADILQRQQATQALNSYIQNRMNGEDPIAEGLRYLWRWSNENTDYQTLADEAGIPVGTVRSRMFRARQELKERLGHHFH